MTLSHDIPLPPDLEDVAAELEAGRAVPSPDEAGRIHTRVGIPRRRSRSAMRARLAIASLLAGGMIMSGGGAALALSGESSHGNASSAGYLAPTTAQPQVLGETQGTTPTSATPTTSNASPEVQGAVQGTRQVSSSSVKSLPFTGFAAIPIVLAGIVMLGGGAWLRRRLLTS
ncbi:MAG: hypothetical protein ACJ768_15880 [Gaiellaceae bacterium]